MAAEGSSQVDVVFGFVAVQIHEDDFRADAFYLLEFGLGGGGGLLGGLLGLAVGVPLLPPLLLEVELPHQVVVDGEQKGVDQEAQLRRTRHYCEDCRGRLGVQNFAQVGVELPDEYKQRFLKLLILRETPLQHPPKKQIHLTHLLQRRYLTIIVFILLEDFLIVFRPNLHNTAEMLIEFLHVEFNLVVVDGIVRESMIENVQINSETALVLVLVFEAISKRMK